MPTRTKSGRTCTVFWRRRAGPAPCRGMRRSSPLYQTIFPQMTNWLPEEEGAQLRFEFEAEVGAAEGGVMPENNP